MKEITFLETIKKTLTDASMLGDDCAFLKPELLGNNGLYITQDSLVEDIHFSLKTISPYQLGQKAMQVNFSDLSAMCASPLLVTISLSLPSNISNSFVEDFYIGVNDACLKTGTKVAGGDITGADKICISVTAIGKRTTQCEISRAFAKTNDAVLVSDCHGNSAGGLKLLQNGKSVPQSLINAHLEPTAELEKSQIIAQTVKSKKIKFAMMDTSDGLADALFKIAQDSKVQIDIDFSKIPITKDLMTEFPDQYKDLIFWGGEDYKLVCCIEEDIAKELVKQGFWKIGSVAKATDKPSVVIKDEKNQITEEIDKEVFSQKSFNHFG